MTPTTLIMAYYENPTMLKEHFKLIRELPSQLRDLLQVIIIDDGSPNHPALAEDLAGAALQIYRLREDIRWNQDACRNIGVRHSETKWVLLTDMDHIVPLEIWERILLGNYEDNFVYNFARVSMPDLSPYKFHPNTWFMTKDIYDKAGGYDERFAGYYGTDGDFRNRVHAVAEVRMFKEAIIRVPRSVIPDASTTYYLRKQPEDRKMIDRIKSERAKLKDQTPLRYRFEYDRVHPPLTSSHH